MHVKHHTSPTLNITSSPRRLCPKIYFKSLTQEERVPLVVFEFAEISSVCSFRITSNTGFIYSSFQHIHGIKLFYSRSVVSFLSTIKAPCRGTGQQQLLHSRSLQKQGSRQSFSSLPTMKRASTELCKHHLGTASLRNKGEREGFQ